MADVPEASSSNTNAFATLSEMIDVINDGVAELQDILVNTFDDYLTTFENLTTTASTQTTKLPEEFLKLRHMFLLDGTERHAVEPYDFQDLNALDSTETSSRPRYKILGNLIYWHPLPDGAYTIECWYVRRFKRLEDSYDFLRPEIPTGWDRYLVAFGAAYLLAKEESDPSPALLAMQQVRKTIEITAQNRDTSRPKKVTNVLSRFSSDRRNYKLPYPKE